MKKVFQSSEGKGSVGGEEVAVILGVVVVEALRVRQRDGVKKDEGVEVAVGGFAARTENLEREITRVLMDGKAADDERLRLGLEVEVVKNGRARGDEAAAGR